MSNFDNLSARSRYFRVLLYPDNELHQKAFETIQQKWANEFIGIIHKEQDGEKEHIHIVLCFKNPRVTSSVCNVLGFVDPTGLADDQFVRAIVKGQSRKVDQQLKSCCIYLLHKNAPEKEQYEISDLFGNKDMIAFTRKECIKYDLKEIDMPDSVQGILDWISSQDDMISAVSFGRWLCNTPYFKANNNKIVWAALKEHNLRIYKAKNAMPVGGFDVIQPDDALRLTREQLGEFETFDDLSEMGFVFGD